MAFSVAAEDFSVSRDFLSEGTSQLGRALARTSQISSPEDATLTVTHPELLPAGKDHFNYTIMIYMTGSNLESMNGSSTADIEEMLGSGIDLTSSHLILYTGGAQYWHSSIPSSSNSVIDLSLVTDSCAQGIVARTEKNADMGAPETLTAFVNFCTTNYPADHYGLIFWDHGGGPVWGYGSDELYDSDSLLLPEMKEAMNKTQFGTWSPRKLDFVGFDACLMGSLECMKVWQNYAHYYISSEEIEPGKGWDYTFLQSFNQTSDPQVLGRSMVDSYMNYHQDRENPSDLTLALVDLSRISGVVRALNRLARAVTEDLKDGYYSRVQQARSSVRTFGNVMKDDRQTFCYDVCDLKDLARQFQSDYPVESSDLIKCLDQMVVYSRATNDPACGVSIYYPWQNRDTYLSARSFLRYFVVSPSYQTLLETLSFNWLRAGAADWVIGDLDKNETGYTYTLSEEMQGQVSNITYTVLFRNGDSYYPVLSGVKVRPASDGTVSVPADPNVICMRSICMRSEGMESEGMESEDMHSTGMQSTGMESEGMESEDMHSTCMHSTGMQSTGMHSEGLNESDADTVTVWPFRQVQTARKFDTYISEQTYLEDGFDHARCQLESLQGSRIPVSVNILANHRTGSLSVSGVYSPDGSLTAGRDNIDLSHWHGISYTAVAQTPVRTSDGRTTVFSEWNTESQADHTCSLHGRPSYSLQPVSQLPGEYYVQLTFEDASGHLYGSSIHPLSSGESAVKKTSYTARGRIFYDVYSDHAVVTGYYGRDDDLILPSAVENIPVTQIQNLKGAYSEAQITLPDTVTNIGSDALSGLTHLQEITLSDALLTIGDRAFAGCSSMEKISLPEGLLSLGTNAFQDCTSLASLRLPASLTHLGYGLVSGCRSLASLAVSPENPCYISAKDNSLVLDSSGSTVYAAAFAATGDVMIPDGTKEIAPLTFDGDTLLSSITFPSSLKVIGSYAFYNCLGMKVPDFPSSLESIENQAFGASDYAHQPENGSTGITPKAAQCISLGAALSFLGEGAFDLWTSRSFTVDDENPCFSVNQGCLMNRAGDKLLYYAADGSPLVRIPEGCISFDWGLMNLMSELSQGQASGQVEVPAYFDLIIPDSVDRFLDGRSAVPMDKIRFHCSPGSAAWDYAIQNGIPHDEETDLGYRQLTAPTPEGELSYRVYHDHAVLTGYQGSDSRLAISEKVENVPVTGIGDGLHSIAGNVNTTVTLVDLPASVQSINSHALSNFYGLETVNLPDQVHRIDNYAIPAQAQLEDLPAEITYLGKCFGNISTAGTLKLPSSLSHISPGAFDLSKNLRAFEVAEGNTSYESMDGFLYETGGRTLIASPDILPANIVIPEGTIRIGQEAFRRREIRSLTLPDSLVQIDSYAFAGCTLLSSITFGKSLDGIGDHAFYECSSLRSLALPQSLCVLGSSCFCYCENLEDLALPDGLEQIGDRAFMGDTRLQIDSLPERLIGIGPLAFCHAENAHQEASPDEHVVTIGTYLTSIDPSALFGLSCTAFEVDPANKNYTAICGFLTSRNGSTLICCPSEKGPIITLPDSILAIGQNAFTDCGHISEIYLSAAIQYISPDAFPRYLWYSDYPYILHCAAGSYAERYCIRNGLPYTIE